MAMPTSRRVLTGLVTGMLAQTSAKVLCENGTSSKSCLRAQPARHAQDHLLIQVKRSETSKVKWADAARCSFATSPDKAYYWETECSADMVGCWADGVHAECRFCDYEGIRCPETAWWPIQDICNFSSEPLPADVGYYYEEACPDIDGGLGCKADGQHMGCRLCGGGAYAHVPCKDNHCTFASEPDTPYYYDHSCETGMLGCNADRVHLGCRFCGKRPFENVTCPRSASYPVGKAGRCWFPNEPVTKYYWEEDCRMGVLGCWADGIHPQCRFCSNETGSPYAAVPCP